MTCPCPLMPSARVLMPEACYCRASWSSQLDNVLKSFSCLLYRLCEARRKHILFLVLQARGVIKQTLKSAPSYVPLRCDLFQRLNKNYMTLLQDQLHKSSLRACATTRTGSASEASKITHMFLIILSYVLSHLLYSQARWKP